MNNISYGQVCSKTIKTGASFSKTVNILIPVSFTLVEATLKRLI